MNRYRAYGLDIASERPLPLRPSTSAGEPGLTIAFAEPGTPERPSGPDRRALVRTETGWTLRYDNREGGWMAFEYSERERSLLASGSVAPEVLEGPLTGLIFGVVHREGGASPLHGACLRNGDGAVAILGASGQGKSTLAAALLALGAELLTEDLLVLRGGGDGLEAEPGSPTLHLLADSHRYLATGLPAGDPVAINGDGKVRLVLPAGPAEPARLAAIYMLEPLRSGGATGLERLSGPRAIGALAEHLYGSPWIRPADSADLAACARLAGQVPIFALSRPESLAGVHETAGLLRRRGLEGSGS